MPHALTELLLGSRASGIPISDLSDDVIPQTAEEAYRVQDETIAVLGAVGAWKMQPLPETGLPFASPILATNVFSDRATLHASDFHELGIEVEVAVTLNRDFPQLEAGYIAADMPPAIGSIHVAFELLASRFIERTKTAKLAGIADLQSSGGVVVGPPVAAHTLPEFGQQRMTLEEDGTTVAQTEGNATTSNMMASLAWLANHAAGRGLPLKAGMLVITGARLGPVTVTGKSITARADGLGSVSVTFD